MKNIITYGTFDTIHFGHISLLRRAKGLGTHLTVGLSTDEFNKEKGKQSYFSYDQRKEFLEAIRYVDLVIPERVWTQKLNDIVTHNIDILTMGDDWKDKFASLKEFCTVHYLDRTPEISSTLIKANIRIFNDKP